MVCLSLNIQQVFSLWRWCLCSLTRDNEPTSDIYFLHQVTQFYNVQVRLQVSWTQRRKFPNVKLWAVCFLLGTQQKAAEGLLLSFGENTWMVPDPGALPKQGLYVVSIFSQVVIKLETACTGGISFPSRVCKAAVIWALSSETNAKWSKCWDFYFVCVLVQTLAGLLIDYFFLSSHTLGVHNSYTN